MAEASRGRALLLRGAAVALAIGLTVAVVEGLSAAALHYVEADPQPPEAVRRTVRLHDRSIRTVPDPWLLFRVAPDVHDDWVDTDSHGLRNGPIPEEPGPDVFRVLLLGGSVAWGYSALDNSQTLAAELERWLDAHRDRAPALRGRTVQVLNGGVPAYVSWQCALAYDLDRRHLHPAVVISLDGANDVSAAIRTGEAGVPMRWDVVRGAYLAPEPTLAGWLAHRVARMKVVRLAQALRPAPVSAFAPPPPRAVADAYRRAIEQMADAARPEGALVMPVLQPVASLEGTKPLAPYERALVEHYESQRPGSSAYYQEAFDAMRGMYAQLAAARPDLLPFDATRVFAGRQEVLFTDPAHLSQEGREVLAAAIGERLLERLAR